MILVTPDQLVSPILCLTSWLLSPPHHLIIMTIITRLITQTQYTSDITTHTVIIHSNLLVFSRLHNHLYSLSLKLEEDLPKRNTKILKLEYIHKIRRF